MVYRRWGTAQLILKSADVSGRLKSIRHVNEGLTKPVTSKERSVVEGTSGGNQGRVTGLADVPSRIAGRFRDANVGMGGRNMRLHNCPDPDNAIRDAAGYQWIAV